MRLSSYYIPFLKTVAHEGSPISHQLLLRAGMIRRCISGIYAWLPAGFRVLQKIEGLIRDEMRNNGVHDMLMPCVQSSELWRESGRYDSYGQEMLRFTDRSDRELLFGPTNEEMITDLLRNEVRSYKSLPIKLHHIQWKFRDEIRPKGGLMRSREFLMSDAYSFDIDLAAAQESYRLFYKIYLDIFKKMGVKVVPVRADSGAIGGDLSHEFILLCDSGETEIIYDVECLELMKKYHDSGEKSLLEILRAKIAITSDLTNTIGGCKQALSTARGIEVGHVFYFGTKYSSAMGAKVSDQHGEMTDIHMGSYGIGVSRLVAAIVEANKDDRGIKWPLSVAPFQFGLLLLNKGDVSLANDLYKELGAVSEVLYDDTNDSNGEKFSRMDLMGLPFQIIVGPKCAPGYVEVSSRSNGVLRPYSVGDLLENYQNIIVSGDFESRV